MGQDHGLGPARFRLGPGFTKTKFGELPPKSGEVLMTKLCLSVAGVWLSVSSSFSMGPFFAMWEQWPQELCGKNHKYLQK